MSGLDTIPLEVLAEEGNLELALRLLSLRSADEREEADRRMYLQTIPPASQRVFVPLVLEDLVGVPVPDEPGLLTSIAIREGAHPSPWADDEARDAAARAVRDAWADVGGAGEPPPVTACLGIGEAIPVRGGSAYLAIYLAAVAELGDQRLRDSVLATGSFDAPLDRVDAKARLARRAREHLGVKSALYAERAPDRSVQPLLRVRDREHARRTVFHVDPWHRGAAVRRVHVYCGAGRDEPPDRFRDVVSIELPARLEAKDVPEAVARWRASIEGARRVEVSTAGPVVLAAALGFVARNDARTVVRVVDANTGQVMWDNRAQTRSRPEERPMGARVVVGRESASVPRGWKHHVIPEHVTAHDMADIVRGFLAEHGGAPTLDLAFATMGPVAWAVTGMLKNQTRLVRVHHWNGQGYEPWFELRSGSGDVHPIAGGVSPCALAPLFVNACDRPSAAWPEAQRTAAEALVGGRVVDLPGGFPAVDPDATPDEVLAIARQLAERILAEAPTAVFLAGESGVAFAATALLLARGVRVVSPVMRREVAEALEGADVPSGSEPEFVRWRDVRLPREP